MPSPLIILSAGEASGDKLGAALATELTQLIPDATIAGVGGDAMAVAGVDIIADYRPLMVMGYWDVLTSLPAILKVRRCLLRAVRDRRPALFVGIDAPDFNLSVARHARDGGAHTVQYVAPSVWMWRRGRLPFIRRAVDAVYCLLPFEAAVFNAAGIRATFVGHPAATRPLPMRQTARQRLGVGMDDELVAVLPGSRRAELVRHLPLFAETIRLLQKGGRRFAAAAATAADEAAFRVALPQVVCGNLADVLAAADVAIVKSGTVTLEAAMAGTPMVVVYKPSKIAAWMAHWRTFALPYFSLPNILAGRFIVPELLLEEANAVNIAREVNLLATDTVRRDNMRKIFSRQRAMLAGAPQTAAENIAALLSC